MVNAQRLLRMPVDPSRRPCGADAKNTTRESG
jgi:hypothetical protein